MTAKLSTSDGLAMTYDAATGRATALCLDGRPIAPGALAAGFLVHDVGVWSEVLGFADGRCETLGLTLEARVEADDDAIRVAGQISDTSGRDRAITLTFALPVDGLGWTWHDDARRSHKIHHGEVAVNDTSVGAGVTGGMSYYPFGCITNGDAGLALGMDMDCPAICRISYDAPAGRFMISFDFGLAPETKAFPSAAPFRFVIYRTDGRWGFRSAAKRFFDLFPQHFTCRSIEQGIWMPFANVSEVDGWEDFGFRYHEGIGDETFDNANGVLPFRYTEPCTFWMPMDPAIERTPENVAAELKKWAESDDPDKRRQAAAVLSSGSHDQQGQIQYRAWNKPWCDGAVFSMNPNPNIPGDSECDLYWNEQTQRELYEDNPRGMPGGEYLDSLEAYATEEENFRRDHFEYVTVPLTFSTVQRRPMIHKSQSIYEYTRYLSAEMHAMDKLLFANDSPNRYATIAAHLDVCGMEVGWIDADGLWRPPEDAWMLFKRTICYHKPFLFLLNTRHERCGPVEMEKYFQRCLFYGMFPSMFSFNAHSEPYWGRPEMYNRDRPLFKKYLPTTKRLAEAGWESITGARSDDDALLIERFGRSGDGGVFLTLLNDTEQSRRVTVRIDCSELGLAETSTIEDMITGDGLTIRSENGTMLIEVDMTAEQVCALSL